MTLDSVLIKDMFLHVFEGSPYRETPLYMYVFATVSILHVYLLILWKEMSDLITHTHTHTHTSQSVILLFIVSVSKRL